MVFRLFCSVFVFLFSEYHFIDLQICIYSVFYSIAVFLSEAQIVPSLASENQLLAQKCSPVSPCTLTQNQPFL